MGKRRKKKLVGITAVEAKKEGAALHETNFVDESNFVNERNFVNEYNFVNDSNFTLGNNKEHRGKAFAVSHVQVDDDFAVSHAQVPDDATDFCLPRSHRADSGFFSRPTQANKPVVWHE